MAMLEFTVLTICAFFSTARFGAVPGYASERMRYNNDFLGVVGSIDLGCWKLALSVGLFLIMEKYDIDPVMSLLALLRTDKINFVVAKKTGLLSFRLEDSIELDL